MRFIERQVERARKPGVCGCARAMPALPDRIENFVRVLAQFTQIYVRQASHRPAVGVAFDERGAKVGKAGAGDYTFLREGRAPNH